jgi:hypothetical protein
MMKTNMTTTVPFPLFTTVEPLSAPLLSPLSRTKPRIRVTQEVDALAAVQACLFRGPTLESWSASKATGKNFDLSLLMLSRPGVEMGRSCIYSKSRPARAEQAGRMLRCQRAAEQAGCDCVPGCEEKARDLTKKRVARQKKNTRCAEWTGRASHYTLVRGNTGTAPF